MLLQKQQKNAPHAPSIEPKAEILSAEALNTLFIVQYVRSASA